MPYQFNNIRTTSKIKQSRQAVLSTAWRDWCFNCGQKFPPMLRPVSPIKQKILGNTRFPRILVGGDKRDRTADLLNAIQRVPVDFQGFLVFE